MNKEAWDLLVDKVAREIYDGKQSGIIDPDMVKLHAQELMKAIQEGFGENIDSTVDEKKYTTLYQLQTNVFHFSGAKNWNQLQEMSSLLTDKNNSTLPFADFLKAVKSIDETYNQTYLKAEYVNAVVSGQMASKWEQFVAEESALPNLRWVVAAGENVCKLCEGLNNITLPLKHPFWKTNFVPRHFFCDCTIVQEEDGVPLTDIANKKIPETSPMFQNNVGISGMAFTDKAPYIKSMPEKVKQQVFIASEELMPKKKSNRILIQEGYVLKDTDKNTGAELWVHQHADTKDLKHNIEKSKIFLENSISMNIREHSNKDGVKNPELEQRDNGKIGDFKHPQKDTHNSLQSQLESAGEQKAQFAAIILEGRKFTTKDIVRALRGGFQEGFNSSLEYIYLITENRKTIRIDRAEVMDWSFLKKLKLL